jgi:small subunit ribosomal protein S10e
MLMDFIPNSLHVPTEIVPATHKKTARAARPGQPAARAQGEGGAYRAPRGENKEGGDYRRRYDDKKEGAGSDYRPRFSGVGRGAGAPAS